MEQIFSSVEFRSGRRDALGKSAEKAIGFLLRHGLSHTWELFYQPKLATASGNVVPDFLGLHPKKGLVIFEVKDWALNEKYEICGESFTYGTKVLEHPVLQVRRYRRAANELFQAHLPAQSVLSPAAGIFFPWTSKRHVAAWFAKAGVHIDESSEYLRCKEDYEFLYDYEDYDIHKEDRLKDAAANEFLLLPTTLTTELDPELFRIVREFLKKACPKRIDARAFQGTD